LRIFATAMHCSLLDIFLGETVINKISIPIDLECGAETNREVKIKQIENDRIVIKLTLNDTTSLEIEFKATFVLLIISASRQPGIDQRHHLPDLARQFIQLFAICLTRAQGLLTGF
jgi:hypothetical protein